MATETRRADELKVSDNIYRDGYIYTISHIDAPGGETLTLWFISPRYVEGDYEVMTHMVTHIARPLTVYV